MLEQIEREGRDGREEADTGGGREGLSRGRIRRKDGFRSTFHTFDFLLFT